MPVYIHGWRGNAKLLPVTLATYHTCCPMPYVEAIVSKLITLLSRIYM